MGQGPALAVGYDGRERRAFGPGAAEIRLHRIDAFFLGVALAQEGHEHVVGALGDPDGDADLFDFRRVFDRAELFDLRPQRGECQLGAFVFQGFEQRNRDVCRFEADGFSADFGQGFHGRFDNGFRVRADHRFEIRVLFPELLFEAAVRDENGLLRGEDEVAAVPREPREVRHVLRVGDEHDFGIVRFEVAEQV